jgi:hypothetical protein
MQWMLDIKGPTLERREEGWDGRRSCEAPENSDTRRRPGGTALPAFERRPRARIDRQSKRCLRSQRQCQYEVLNSVLNSVLNTYSKVRQGKVRQTCSTVSVPNSRYLLGAVCTKSPSYCHEEIACWPCRVLKTANPRRSCTDRICAAPSKSTAGQYSVQYVPIRSQPRCELHTASVDSPVRPSRWSNTVIMARGIMLCTWRCRRCECQATDTT